MFWLSVCLFVLLQGARGADDAGCVQAYLGKYSTPVQPYSDSTLLYFLHVPRTAGRTFHSCFLKLGTTPARRCPKAYDHLRMDPHSPSCFLLSSHDDFSIVEELPRNVAVITHLRDPVDRVLSAYEFTVEVSARSLKRPENVKKKGDRISTDDVWPWSYLIPWMSDDLKERAERVKQEHAASGTSSQDEEIKLQVEDLDPYDNPLVMPLKDFIESAPVHELLHNGGYLQVMGLTNYSRWSDAPTFRHCALHDGMREEFVAIAKKRLNTFSHVGTTDRLLESIASAAVSLNMPLDGVAYAGSEVRVGDARGLREDEDDTAAVTARAEGGHGEEHGDAAVEQQAAGRGAAELQQAVANARGQASDTQHETALEAAVEQARQQLQENEDLLAQARDTSQQATQQTGRVATDKPLLDKLVAARKRAQRLQGARRQLQSVTQEDSQAARPPLELGAPEDIVATQRRLQSVAQEDIEAALKRVRMEQHLLEQAAAGATGDSTGDGAGAEDLQAAADGDEAAERDLQAQPLPYTLGEEYHRCVQRAGKRNKQRKRTSLANLRMPDGRVVNFSKETRKLIPDSIIQRIRELNALDTELHQHGLKLLEERRQQHAAAGLLKELVPAADVSAEPHRQPTSRRRAAREEL